MYKTPAINMKPVLKSDYLKRSGEPNRPVKTALKCPKGGDSDDESDKCTNCVPSIYRELVVSGVPNPAWLFVDDGKWTGASIDLAHAIASYIPGVKKLTFVEKSNERVAVEDLIIGTSVIDITPLDITRERLLNQLAALKVDDRTATTSYLIYKSSGCPATSIASVVAGKPPADVLDAILAAINGGANLNVSVTSLGSTQDQQVANFPGDHLISNNVPAPTTPSGIVELFDEILANIPDVVSVCNVAFLAPYLSLTDEFLANLLALGFSAISVPLDTNLQVLGLGFYFLKYASPLGLWLQSAFDKVVSSGKYAKILQKYGLLHPPVTTALPAVQIPEACESLHAGSIPRVAVYDVYLPAIPRCSEDLVAHNVKLNVSVTGQ